MKKNKIDFTARPLSWSAMSSFEWNKEQWYKRYILKEREEPSSAMLFGKEIGQKLAADSSFLPAVPRLPVFEYKVTGTIASIPLVGYLDAFDKDNKKVLEFKTGKKWDKKKADTHGQIDLYCALLYEMHKILPSELDIRIVWLATEQNTNFETQFITDMKPVIFTVKKSMNDIINMHTRVKKTVQAMNEYVIHRALA